MIALDFTTRSRFADRKEITSRVQKNVLRGLGYVGGYIKKAAKRRIRPAKRVSVANLSPTEKAAYDAQRKAKRQRLKTKQPAAIFVYRDGATQAVDWSDATARERRNWHIARNADKRRQVRRPFAASLPGESPRSQTGKLRQYLDSNIDPDAVSVVIGPSLIASSASKGDAPSVLEYGGTTTITKGPRKGQKADIAARPYMQPAYRDTAPSIENLLRARVSN